jgi:hypothetical protein
VQPHIAHELAPVMISTLGLVWDTEAAGDVDPFPVTFHRAQYGATWWVPIVLAVAGGLIGVAVYPGLTGKALAAMAAGVGGFALLYRPSRATDADRAARHGHPARFATDPLRRRRLPLLAIAVLLQVVVFFFFD